MSLCLALIFFVSGLWSSNECAEHNAYEGGALLSKMLSQRGRVYSASTKSDGRRRGFLLPNHLSGIHAGVFLVGRNICFQYSGLLKTKRRHAVTLCLADHAKEIPA